MQWHWGYSDVKHLMTNYHLRQAGMNRRHTLAEGDSHDFKLQFETPIGKGAMTYGLDVHQADHEANIGDPGNAMFFVENFDGVERDVAGLFSEYRVKLDNGLGIEAGLRVNRVEMDADEVNSSMTMMLKFDHAINDNWAFLAGISRKTRSPSYQEKYLWLPMQSTGGLADGKTYIGDVDLNPEVSKEIELGFRYTSQAVLVEPRFFFKNVDDYIQGETVTEGSALMLANMMNPAGGAPLQFSNVEADIYGMDLETLWHIKSRLDMRGMVSVIRGERDDVTDNLYRIAPDNAMLALDYSPSEKWRGTFELRGYRSQSRVSDISSEQKTAGYSLVNLYATIKPHNDVELAVGVENLFDKQYDDHLGGYNRVMGSDIAVGDRLPGTGMNLFAKVKWNF
jgi:iron complex outermembrane receptor protein